MNYNCLIVDDELPARELVQNYLSKIPEANVVASCKNVIEAKSILQEEQVDILFLDIQMPEINGLEFLRLLKEVPATILITAHSEHALEGYELDVVDYLLKPVEFGRFYKAFVKAMNIVSTRSNTNKQVQSTRVPKNSQSDTKSIFIKTDKEIVKVDIEDILFIESMREYVKVFTGNKKLITLQSLSKFEEALPAENFFRVHRSYIVNVNSINKIMGNTIIIGDHKVPISRGQRQSFLDLINKQKLF